MLAFVRELRTVLQDRSLAQYKSDRVRNLAVENCSSTWARLLAGSRKRNAPQIGGVPWR